MRITTDHPASSFGVPVVLDDDGEPMGYADGVKLIRDRLGLRAADLAERCGVSARTVEGWEQGRHAVPAAALNVMAELIRPRKSGKRPASRD